jgi:hypothetical protein
LLFFSFFHLVWCEAAANNNPDKGSAIPAVRVVGGGFKTANQWLLGGRLAQRQNGIGSLRRLDLEDEQEKIRPDLDSDLGENLVSDESPLHEMNLH